MNFNLNVKKQIKCKLIFNKKCVSEHIYIYYSAFKNLISNIFIVMKYCENGSLNGIYQKIKKRGDCTDEKIFKKIVKKMLNGLIYLYNRKIIY